MSKFKVGDKVKVYWASSTIWIGVVQAVEEENLFVVEPKGSVKFVSVHAHPKQCRKLIKKPKKYILVFDTPGKGIGKDCRVIACSEDTEAAVSGYTKFVEVKNKK